MNTHAELGDIQPTQARFLELSGGPEKPRVIPVTMTLLADSLTPVGIYQALAAERPGTFLLESTAEGGFWSRYSFIGAGSKATLTEKDGKVFWFGEVPDGIDKEGDDPVAVFEQVLQTLSSNVRDEIGTDLPHFISGLVGYLGWEVSRRWADLPNQPEDDLQLPELAVNLVSDLAIHDLQDGTVTLVANAINMNGLESGAEAAYEDAVQRLHKMAEQLARPARATLSVAPQDWLDTDPRNEDRIHHSWPEEEFLATVEKAQEVIARGELLQLVLSRRFTVDTEVSGFEIYRALRVLNPSPYMFLYTFDRPDGSGIFQLVGSSPESLITLHDGQLVSHPIGGTRPAGKTPEENQKIKAELLADPKERDEHDQLVDVAQIDLERIAVPGTVKVADYMRVEQYSHVMHLVSHISATKDPNLSSLDVMKSAFPAGTLSGDPKPESLVLLDEWEPHARGPYGGTVGYFDFGGNMDQAIAIRTVILKDQVAYVQAGAGIVAQSSPAYEANETLAKATAPLKAVFAAEKLHDYDYDYDYEADPADPNESTQ